MNTWQKFNALNRPAFILSLLWWGSVFIIWPVGEFPLNDDWAYAQNVFYLVEEGRIQFSDWPAMTLIVQVLWGALCCSLFGFSFTVLRFSTLLLGWLGVLVFHRCLLAYTDNRQAALWGALVLLFNPFYFFLSYSFMTDVPFVALMLLSVGHFSRALEAQKPGLHWSLGLLFAILATLIRQLGLLVPLAFALALMLKRQNLRAAFWAILPFTLTGLSLKAYTLWLESLQELPSVYGHPGKVLEQLFSTYFLQEAGWRLGVLLFYLGFFFLPFLPGGLKNAVRPISLFMALISAGALAMLSWEHIPVGNIWNRAGLGPLVLKDTYFGVNLPHFLSSNQWDIVRFLGFLGGAFMLYAFLVSIKGSKSFGMLSDKRLFPALILAPYLLYLLVDYNMFDRYFMVAFVLSIVITIDKWAGLAQRVSLPGVLFLLLLGAFAIAGTKTYLSWNRLRWEMLNQLEAQGIPPTEVDGGFEYNGWHQTGSRRPIRREGKSWWFVAEDKYALSAGALPCYEVLEKIAYRRWLPPFESALYLSKRPTYTTLDTIFCDAEKLDQEGLHLATNQPGIWLDNGNTQDSIWAYSGKKAIRLDSQQAFGFTTRFTDISPCDHFSIKVWRKSAQHQGALVASDFENKVLYLVENANILAVNEAGWELLELEFTIPEDYPANHLLVYVWHQGQEPVWWDDFWIERKS